MNKPHNKDLVLGLAHYFDFSRVRPFLDSLRRTGFSGDVCFIASGLDKKTTDELLRYGVQLYPFKQIYLKLFVIKNGEISVKKLNPCLRLIENSLFHRLFTSLVDLLVSCAKQNEYVIKCNMFKHFLHIDMTRRLMYYLFLVERGQEYRRIMLTDTRDVLFQRDPFDFDSGNKLCCFLEDRAIGHSEINSSWLSHSFGESAVEELKNNRIICSGTVIGVRAAIIKYLEAMIDSLMHIKKYGMDQGIHNYVIYKQLMRETTLYENNNGPIMTLSYTREDVIHLDNRGYLINTDGSIINTLHQYDRLRPELKNRITVYTENGCAI